ncbi:hypothetical protein LTR56_025471 [Elasticomyces elasticus]|nr:hypothetical protein LTR56_025471 [Elasticomyces elasticus]KAK3627187.1 hypothetical protein LTR22_022869 [Elasticomyces elasticus]KAK4907457.1 hypothetical protein LTR49_023521 [Elasticomyces elasticus]
MSNYYYLPQSTLQEEDDFDFSQAFPPSTSQAPQLDSSYLTQLPSDVTEQHLCYDQLQLYQWTNQHQHEAWLASHPPAEWVSLVAPCNVHPVPKPVVSSPASSEIFDYNQIMVTSGALTSWVDYQPPSEAVHITASRVDSLASSASSALSLSRSDDSRRLSPIVSEMAEWVGWSTPALARGIPE